MPTYKALTSIHHNGKRYAVGDVLELTEADAKRIPHAVSPVGAVVSKPVAPIPSPAVTPPNNPDKAKVKK